MDSTNSTAHKAVKDSKHMFTMMINLLEKRSFEVQHQFRSMQKEEVMESVSFRKSWSRR